MRKIAAVLASGWYRVMRSGAAYQIVPRRIRRDQRTIWGDPSMVLTPAQRRARFARSPFWRCISCGKIHEFDESVAVTYASPCTCGNFEFESPFSVLLR